MKIDIFQPLSIHELGNRPNQEDNLFPSPDDVTFEDRLFIVCDGMGGHEKGELASQTICKAIGYWFGKNVNSEEPFTDELLKSAITYAYEKLDEQDNDSLKKMGTTLALVYMHAGGVTAAHIGDSRIYHIRPNVGILYQSRDHSFVFDLYKSGEISYKEMSTHPQKNVITKAMIPGIDNRERPDIIHISNIEPGDYFYLCSDGMLEQMDEEQLYALLSSDSSNDKKRDQLIKATEGNQDNHTAWFVQVKSVSKESGDSLLLDDENTSPCNVIVIKRTLSNQDSLQNQIPHSDVEIASEGDVTIVHTQKKTDIIYASDKITIKESHIKRFIKRNPKFFFFFIFLVIILIYLILNVMSKFSAKENREETRIEQVIEMHEPSVKEKSKKRRDMNSRNSEKEDREKTRADQGKDEDHSREIKESLDEFLR